LGRAILDSTLSALFTTLVTSCQRPIMCCFTTERSSRSTHNKLAEIADNLAMLNERLARAAERAGRPANEISLMAVSKFASAEKIIAAFEAGQRLFGENRIQESQAKILALKEELPETRWSLIGHLQSNKAARAIDLFDEAQSIDSLKIASKLNQRALKIGKTLEIMLEINSSGEPQKYGVSFDEAPGIVEQIMNLRGIRLTGLMTIGPHTKNEKTIREAFASTRALFESLRSDFVQSKLYGTTGQLSMGMSADFELAIREGATLIRIGTAIFGPRESQSSNDN